MQQIVCCTRYRRVSHRQTLLRTRKKLARELNATVLYWDEYDDISKQPVDYVEWYHKDGDVSAWKYPALADTLSKLKSGESPVCPATNKELLATPWIVFDSPLGYDHLETGRFIDFLIWIDTPLDIALTRRTIRDHLSGGQVNAALLREELEYYCKKSRPLFAKGLSIPADLVVDGSHSLGEMRNNIIKFLNKKKVS